MAAGRALRTPEEDDFAMQTYMIAGGAALAAVIGYVSIYNRLRRLAVKVEEGGSDIDVALEKRYDLLSEEIEAVKKFLSHEYETYTAVTGLRSGADVTDKTQEGGALTREQADAINEAVAAQSAKMAEIKTKMAQQRRGKKSGAAGRKLSAGEKMGLLSSIQQSLGGVGTAVNALAEQYPVLYSSVSMEHFQRSISDVEEHLQAARRLYNANVSLYNQTIASFPWLVVARIHGMEKAEFYEIDDKKREFKVNFD